MKNADDTELLYLDASILVSLYLDDEGSKQAEKLLAPRPIAMVTPLHVTEFTHAIHQSVFRRQMTRKQAEALIARFRSDLLRGVWHHRVSVPADRFALARSLADQYTAEIGTRTLDTIHVASALL